MYTTIEADIENGVVSSPESSQIPPHAHVLITLLSISQNGANEPSVSETGPAPTRTPNPAICGNIKVLGNIMDITNNARLISADTKFDLYHELNGLRIPR